MRGILLPLTTVFTADDQIDTAKLRENIAAYNKTGVRGYVIVGSTGERVHLDEREYLQVIETARAATPTDLAFIVGAGQQSTTGTISEIRKAAQAGADAVLVITPHYYRPAIHQKTL